MNTRDNDIHEALEGIDVPSRRADFFDDLKTQLDTEPTPFVRRRRGRAFRTLTAGSVPVAAAVLAALLIVNVDGDRVPPPPVEQRQSPTETEIKPLLARDVVAKMTTALADVKTLKANVTFVQQPYTLGSGGSILDGYTLQGEIRVASDGRRHTSFTAGPNELHGPQMDSYDPRTGTMQTCWQFQPSTWACSKIVGLNPTDASAQEPLELGVMSALLRNAVARDDQAVQTVDFEGRPAWRVSATFTLPFHADAATVTVDQESGHVLDVELFREGKLSSRTTLHDLQVNVPLADSELVVVPPKGAQINPIDDRGSSITNLDDVKASAGYAPLIPDLSEGWVLGEVSFRKSDGDVSPASVNPQGQDIVTITYRRGLEQVTFTTRRTGGGRWVTDPLYLDGDGSFGKTTSTLGSGAFAGTTVTAETLASSQHLWGVGAELVLAVSGDLTADEMVAAANSLHQYRK